MNTAHYERCVVLFAIAAACLLAVGWRHVVADTAGGQRPAAQASPSVAAPLPLSDARLIDLTHAFDERTSSATTLVR